jgi:hypothetical protein
MGEITGMLGADSTGMVRMRKQARTIGKTGTVRVLVADGAIRKGHETSAAFPLPRL